MTFAPGKAVRTAVVALTLPLLAACAETPHGQSFNMLSSSQEAEIGRSQHGEVVKTFGGVYGDPKVQAYVERVGRNLLRGAGMPEQNYTFTVLDSHIVNAMALPGGYVYVTRGLLALANSEAELAGVMAHEIGHVTARHTGERVTQGTLASIGAAILGAVSGSAALGELAGVGAQAYLQSFSRDQEYEADSIGLETMARAGYDPRAMVWFLQTLRDYSRLEAELAGRPADSVDAGNIMASHPRTVDRVERAMQASFGQQPSGRLGREEHLRAVDGMRYGDNPDQGIVRDGSFYHPKLGFAFEVPPGFTVQNGDQAVQARHPQGGLMVFDGGRYRGGDLARYIAEDWARGAKLTDVQRFEVNGMPAATAVTRVRANNQLADLRLVAIGFDQGTVYRFMFITPPGSDKFDETFRRTATSFHRLTRAEASRIQPLRLVVRPARGSVEQMAAALPFPDRKVERFAVLNGLTPGGQVPPQVKTVE